MSNDVPTPPGEADQTPAAGPEPVEPAGAVGTAVRPPRKRFLLLGTGIGLLAVVAFLLLTSLGTNKASGHAPQTGDPVPGFSAQNIGRSGASTVNVSSSGSGDPAVLLFFGAWCSDCHQELPPLAAAVKSQRAAGGALAHVQMIGVDSLDNTSTARTFIKGAGVTFPVAYDPSETILSGDFWFTGDPYAVFLNSDGTIEKIVRGDTLTPAKFTADEEELLHNNLNSV